MILSINKCEEPKIASSNDILLVDDSSNISNIPQFDGFSEDGGEIEFECDSCALKFIVKEDTFNFSQSSKNGEYSIINLSGYFKAKILEISL